VGPRQRHLPTADREVAQGATGLLIFIFVMQSTVRK
jgi:hypothetical protein